VLVRTVAPTGENLGSIVGEFEAAGASIVIGSNRERDAAVVAKAMSVRGVPTISLTSFSDLAIQLYGAGYVPNEEAVVLVNEAAKRGYSSVAVVSTDSPASLEFTKHVLALAAAAGLSVRPVDGTTDSQFQAGITALAAAGVVPAAVVFASGPARAAAMMETLSGDPRFKAMAVIGNSGWALAGKLPPVLKGAWYTAIASDGMAKFAEKFQAANGGAATLDAAMTYDLVVMAAALPQTIGEEPYHPEVMTNPQGFMGFTGQFRFGPSGMASARTYVVQTVK
jgi:ABC-type branched-subunit amino acid transport system substrate-binding protein